MEYRSKMPLWVNTGQERRILESCLIGAQQKLKRYRAAENEIMAALVQADIDRILDELGVIYKRPFGRAPLDRPKQQQR